MQSGLGSAALARETDSDVDLTEVVTTHVSYKRMAAEMFAGLDAAFGEVSTFCSVFLPFAETFLDNEGALESLDAHFDEASDSSAYESSITTYRSQTADFDKVGSSVRIELLASVASTRTADPHVR